MQNKEMQDAANPSYPYAQNQQRQALSDGHTRKGYQITDPQEPGLIAAASQIIECIFGLEELLDSLEVQRDRLLLNMDPPKDTRQDAAGAYDSTATIPNILQAQLALSSARLAMLEGRMRSLLVRLEQGL